MSFPEIYTIPKEFIQMNKKKKPQPILIDAVWSRIKYKL